MGAALARIESSHRRANTHIAVSFLNQLKSQATALQREQNIQQHDLARAQRADGGCLQARLVLPGRSGQTVKRDIAHGPRHERGWQESLAANAFEGLQG